MSWKPECVWRVSNISEWQTSRRIWWSPRGLRRGSTAALLQGLRVRIPPKAWILSLVSVVYGGCTGVCEGLITRPRESSCTFVTEYDQGKSHFLHVRWRGTRSRTKKIKESTADKQKIVFQTAYCSHKMFFSSWSTSVAFRRSVETNSNNVSP